MAGIASNPPPKKRGRYLTHVIDHLKPMPSSTFNDMIRKTRLVSERDTSELLNLKTKFRLSLPRIPLRTLAVNTNLSSFSATRSFPHSTIASNPRHLSNGPTEQTSLYQGSKITRQESMLSLLYLASRPDITMATLETVLELIRLHLPDNAGNVEHLKSLYKFKQICLNAANIRTVRLHHVCPKCSYLFKENEDVCQTSGLCDGTRWQDVHRRQPRAFFIEVDAVQQIRQFFKDPVFVTDIYKVCERVQDGCIRDIYDGILYQENIDFLSKPNNLSLLWHTDGVSVYKSSDVQIWPVQAVVNEIPLRKRFSKKNVVLFGLWFGSSKPNMNSYLEPIVKTLDNMYMNGFEVEFCDKKTAQCHVLALACTMDLPAMSTSKEVHQFNGSFGCGLCEHEGCQMTRKHGRCRIYPYTKTLKLRTHERILEQGKEALKSGRRKTVKGVKGLSVVMLIPRCNIATHFLVDHMHGVCLGVVKRMFQCWFDSVHSKTFCIKDRYEDVDKTFLSIQPPSDIRRPPQSLRRKLRFKASECMYFLLFYGLHVLKDVLPPKYFAHFAMLSRGFYILMSDCIEKTDLAEAEHLLEGWHKHLGSYYGNEQYTINAHNVGNHLVDSVRLGGPLYTHSCFGFESRCGDYSKMVTSTRYPAQQIVSGINIAQDYKALNNSIDGNMFPGVTKLITKDKRNLRDLGDGFVQVGALRTTKLPDEVVTAIQSYNTDLTPIHGQTFMRVECRNVVYEGSHNEKKVYCDQFVRYKDNECILYGCIDSFCTIDDSSMRKHHLALIRPLISYPEADLGSDIPANISKDLGIEELDLFNHIIPVKKSDLLHAVPLNNMANKLVFLPGDASKTWGNVIELPVNFEHN